MAAETAAETASADETRPSIGVNMRVTGHYSQGNRKHMEDKFSVAYQQTKDERDLEYAYFGIFDGHGGSEAAIYAKEHLMETIVKQKHFWSDDDADVLRAIRKGYIMTQMNMWKELEKWPKIIYGLPSTAGTTASVAFIRRGKIYIGHVGDSAIVLGYQVEGQDEWAAIPLTVDHKPDTKEEMDRIYESGGKVMVKAGISRVAWKRYIMESGKTHEQEIPFLAIARSLGDYWSYNTFTDDFIVSPDPDVGVVEIDPSRFRCLIFGTDGLWNMLPPSKAVELVQNAERHNEQAFLGSQSSNSWQNPSKILVDHAISNWAANKVMADNTTVITVIMDPPGPPRNRAPLSVPSRQPNPTPVSPVAATNDSANTGESSTSESHCRKNQTAADSQRAPRENGPQFASPLPPVSNISNYSAGNSSHSSRNTHEGDDHRVVNDYGNFSNSYFITRLLSKTEIKNSLEHIYSEMNTEVEPSQFEEPEEEGENNNNEASDESIKTSEEPPSVSKPEPTPPPTPEVVEEPEDKETEDVKTEVTALEDLDQSIVASATEESIQINEVSSSSPVGASLKLRRRKRKSLINTENDQSDSRKLRSQDASNVVPKIRTSAEKTSTIKPSSQRKNSESKVPVPVVNSPKTQPKKIVVLQSNQKIAVSPNVGKQDKKNVDKSVAKAKKAVVNTSPKQVENKTEVKAKVLPTKVESVPQPVNTRVTRSKDTPGDSKSSNSPNNSRKIALAQEKSKVVNETTTTIKRKDFFRGAITRHKTSEKTLTFCSDVSVKLECHKENVLSNAKRSNNEELESLPKKRRCTRQSEQHQDVTSSLAIEQNCVPESSHDVSIKSKKKKDSKTAPDRSDEVPIEVHSTTVHLKSTNTSQTGNRVLRSTICVTELKDLKDKRPILRTRNSVAVPVKGTVRRRWTQAVHHNLRKRFTK